jgi:hypothetical protein
VPVDFLSAAQIASYGRYGDAPSARQLERFFHFDDRDRELIADRRGDHNRVGFAVQLATVRFLGTFLAHPADVPPVVAKTVAHELGITDPDCLARYARREQTHREHAGEIARSTATATSPSAPRRLSSPCGSTRGRGRRLSARACCSISRPPA